VIIYMPRLGHTTGEMPHVRKPPINWMPGQGLYYLYSSVKNLGHDVRVIDANYSIDPIQEVLDFRADKVLMTTATPTFEDTRRAVRALRDRGYRPPIFVGGPHVSLNAGQRDWLLPPLDGVVYIPLIGSRSTFDWVPTVFPGRTPFEVLGLPDREAQQYLRDRYQSDTSGEPLDARMEALIFSYFRPSMEWMAETYSGDHVRPEMRSIPVRHSAITSIGCSKTCSFCGNPYIYRIGFKRKEVVREMLRDFKANGIDRISVADMFFVMYMPHTRDMMDVFREEGVTYSMQTCLENLTDELMFDLKVSGLQKMLVGVENPVSYSVGKRVEIAKVRWLLDKMTELDLAGAKLSYIVGLPGVDLSTDLSLIDHVAQEVLVRGHPLQDLQVNLYTPYRPEGDTEYQPYGEREPARRRSRPLRLAGQAAQRIQLLDQIPYSYWGSFPVGISDERDLHRQMVLCDVVYDVVYPEFLPEYLGVREQYVDDLGKSYPGLVAHVPTFDESRRAYAATVRSTALRTAIGNDEGHGRRVLSV
jgi:hypothetical protein